jgi:hypothetical protein
MLFWFDGGWGPGKEQLAPAEQEAMEKARQKGI